MDAFSVDTSFRCFSSCTRCASWDATSSCPRRVLSSLILLVRKSANRRSMSNARPPSRLWLDDSNLEARLSPSPPLPLLPALSVLPPRLPARRSCLTPFVTRRATSNSRCRLCCCCCCGGGGGSEEDCVRVRTTDVDVAVTVDAVLDCRRGRSHCVVPEAVW